MRAPVAPLLLVLSTVAGSLSAQTESSQPVTPPVASSPRAVSPETAAKLAALAPKFVPPKTDEEKSATSTTDKPHNMIPRLPIYLLPSYVVQEPKLREFKPRELLTPKAKIELFYKSHPGLYFNPLFFLGSNRGIAAAMIAEEERLERMQEAEDLLSLLRYTNDDPKGEIATKMRQSFIRHDE